jgi:hypothetical protein
LTSAHGFSIGFSLSNIVLFGRSFLILGIDGFTVLYIVRGRVRGDENASRREDGLEVV